MKQLLLTTIGAVLLVGCATTQSPEPLISKAPDISIHEAVAAGNIKAVKQHLDAGADVNVKAIRSGFTPLYSAIIHGHTEITELLIAKGADVNAKYKHLLGTPLHAAVFDDRSEIAELLIAKGADVNAKNNERGSVYLTPLDMARNYPETASLLRKHGGKTSEAWKTEGK
ncbi:ankyrin repeat domain-containing protein [Verrucomicrobia bacterium]|nr:ankyrin repeat domain-containing protein [Verrucomicrobiota bacterium]